MRAKELRTGDICYYWEAPSRARQAGFAVPSRPLGGDYAIARPTALELNQSLEDWYAAERAEKAGVERVQEPCGFGTIRWWLHLYERETNAFAKLSERSADEYRRHLRYVENLALEKPRGALKTLGDLPVSSLSAKAVDRLYVRLKTRVETKADGTGRVIERKRQAHFEIDILKKAWRSVQRIHSKTFPAGNPFEGLERDARGTETKRPASSQEAYTLAETLREMGHAHLGAAALVCFEWLQRPENVLSGSLRWDHYRPGVAVRVEHHKTRAMTDLELRDPDTDEAFFPEIERYLGALPRLGEAIVLRSDGAPYQRRHAHSVVAKARKSAALPDGVTLSGCRHGGITELGDADLTEAQGMALSAHTTPDAFRGYVKRTSPQRVAGLRKRRAWREES